MKTFNELSKRQQKMAMQIALDELLTAVIEGAVRFNDKESKDTMQASIDEAIEKAGKMHTPWFSGSYIMDATYDSEMERRLSVGEALKGMARVDAEDAIYPEKGERVIQL